MNFLANNIKILMKKIQEVNFSQQEKDTFLKMLLEALGHSESQSFKHSWITKEESKESLPKLCMLPSLWREEDEDGFLQGGYGCGFLEEKVRAFVLFLRKWRLECLDLIFKDQNVWSLKG